MFVNKLTFKQILVKMVVDKFKWILGCFLWSSSVVNLNFLSMIIKWQVKGKWLLINQLCIIGLNTPI